VADYLVRARGLKCQPKQVAIVSGVQEALDLCARLFLNPGDRVCLEDPGYPGAGRAFEAVGAKITAVGVDEEGIQLSKLRSARLIYVTPAHQFPLGITMSLPRRLALLEKARQNNALIFEDDYDSEFRYSGRPVPALQGLDRHGCVLFAGSFSKVMFPSLRLGYLVVPDDLVDRIAAAKSITSRHAPLLEQAVLCEFMDKGLFGQHIRRMREVYADRLSALLENARQRLSGLLEISDVEAGLQTVGWLSGRTTAEQVAKTAGTRGLQVFPISRYSRCLYFREGIQLGFAAITPPEIRRGINELARVLEFGSRKVRD
jgi:GntR family transcriptional regulator/MocR family aminotransferase